MTAYSYAGDPGLRSSGRKDGSCYVTFLASPGLVALLDHHGLLAPHAAASRDALISAALRSLLLLPRHIRAAIINEPTTECVTEDAACATDGAAPSPADGLPAAAPPPLGDCKAPLCPPVSRDCKALPCDLAGADSESSVPVLLLGQGDFAHAWPR